MKKISKVLLIIITIAIIIGCGIILYLYFDKQNGGSNLDADVTNQNNNNDNNDDAENIFSIKDKEFHLFNIEENQDRDDEYSGMKFLEYDNSNSSYAQIYYISYDYYTDPGIYYTLNITDEQGNNILYESQEQKIIGGVVSSTKIKKIDLDSKINFLWSEKIEGKNTVSKSETIQLDLKQDLEKVEKITNTNIKEAKLGDIKFNYIEEGEINFDTSQHAYSKKLKGEYCSIPTKNQYGNHLLNGDDIGISYEKNVNSLSLQQAFDDLKLIEENFGNYGLSDVYGINQYDEKENFIKTVTISFDEMMKLCNGEEIQKDGIKYNVKSFNEHPEPSRIKDEDVEIGNGIEAIKFHYEPNDTFTYYMFIYKDNIYQLSLPNSDRLTSDLNEFLNNIEKI